MSWYPWIVRAHRGRPSAVSPAGVRGRRAAVRPPGASAPRRPSAGAPPPRSARWAGAAAGRTPRRARAPAPIWPCPPRAEVFARMHLPLLHWAPMLLATPARLPQRIAIFIVPKFSMMDFTAVIEAQRIANRMSRRELYSWHILSKDGRPVAASNGIAMAAEAPLAEA